MNGTLSRGGRGELKGGDEAVMGKRYSGRRGKGTREPFVMISKRLLESPAWLDLSSNAKVIYIHLKKQKQNADCNEKIKLPYRDRRENPLSFRSFSRAIKALIEHGFVELEEKGGLERRPNVYRLSEKWEEWKEGTKYPQT